MTPWGEGRGGGGEGGYPDSLEKEIKVITRYTAKGLDEYVVESSDAREQRIINDCKSLGLRLYMDKGDGTEKLFVTGLLKSETACAALDLLREAGHQVNITNGLFYPDKYALLFQRSI
jgi:hypothetical protein